jgi:hypothetical protein
MVELVLTDDQAAFIEGTADDVVLRDRHGRSVGRVIRADQWYVENEAEIVQRILDRKDVPQRSYTSEEVFARLKSLESPQ